MLVPRTAERAAIAASAAQPHPQKPPRSRGLIFVAILTVLAAGAAYWQRRAAVTRAKPAPVVRTATVRTGNLERTLRLTGSTVAGRSSVLLAPRLPGARGVGQTDFHMYLEKLVAPGSYVRKGDVVAQFDRQYMLIRMDDYLAAVVQHEAYLKTLESALNIKRTAHRQRTRSAQGEMEKAALNLKTAPVRSAIQTERYRLAYEEARARFKQLTGEFKFVEVSERAAIRRSELDLQQWRIEMRRAQGNVDRMVVRAPIDGLTVVQTIHRGGDESPIQAGDQIHAGMPFMQVVDLRSIVVEAAVNQVDAETIRVGARARVRLDAFPDLELPARVLSIGAMAQGGGYRRAYVKQIPVRLKLDKMDPRVIPNFSVSADVVVKAARDAVIVPLAGVFTSGPDRPPHAFVQAAEGWEKRELQLGLANNLAAAVESGLREGETVALDPPPAEAAYQ